MFRAVAKFGTFCRHRYYEFFPTMRSSLTCLATFSHSRIPLKNQSNAERLVNRRTAVFLYRQALSDKNSRRQKTVSTCSK